MNRHDPDDEDDFGDEWAGVEDEGEAETVPCPSCGAEVYEDAPRCPGCGEYIVHPTSAWHGRPLAWILLGLAGIGAVLWSLMWF